MARPAAAEGQLHREQPLHCDWGHGQIERARRVGSGRLDDELAQRRLAAGARRRSGTGASTSAPTRPPPPTCRRPWRRSAPAGRAGYRPDPLGGAARQRLRPDADGAAAGDADAAGARPRGPPAGRRRARAAAPGPEVADLLRRRTWSGRRTISSWCRLSAGAGAARLAALGGQVTFFLSVRSFDPLLPSTYVQELTVPPPSHGGFEASPGAGCCPVRRAGSTSCRGPANGAGRPT